MFVKGFEHRLFFRLVSLGLPKGIDSIANDTTRRKKYLKSNPNFPNNLVLISCLTYCENVLNSGKKSNKWIKDYGGKFKKILKAMKIVRNAWTHNNGDISKNWNFLGMDGVAQYKYAEKVLQSNNADKKSYEFDNANYTISVLPDGCNRICAVCTSIFKNAGEIVIT